MNPAGPSPSPLPALMAEHRIFGQLAGPARAALAGRWETARAATGALLVAPGQLGARLGWVIAGEVEMRDPDLGLAVRLAAGELFGAGATPPRPLRAWQASAASECEIAFLPLAALRQACEADRGFAYFFPSLDPMPHGAHAPLALDDAPNLLDVPVRTLLGRAPVTIAPATPVREAAALMHREQVSSVLLTDQDGRLVGLVTDRDLRNRALAPGLDLSRPVAEIATLAPHALDASRPAYEAQLLMARHAVHHVPITEQGRIAGMVTATELTERHGTSAVYLAGAIDRAGSVDELVQAAARVKQLQRNLAAAEASAHSTGRILSSVTDALTRRLLQLGEQQLGPPPVPYAWVAAGSQARAEQTGKTDQDNCMVLDDGYDEAAHGAYFDSLSRFACAGLDACGYVYCPGEMMAMTPKWRQPRRRWAAYFRDWIEEPDPMALMLTSVFFDLRAVDGDAALLDSLRAEVLARTRGHSLFLAQLAGNALKHRPPLGLFGHILPARGGEHAGTIDLKHAAIVPIVDLARVYALAGAVEAVNTHERLLQAPAAGEVSEQGARDLREALEFLGRLRLAHQARQLQAGLPPDNFLALEEISNFERSQLKDAFAVVRTMQQVLEQRYA